MGGGDVAHDACGPLVSHLSYQVFLSPLLMIRVRGQYGGDVGPGGCVLVEQALNDVHGRAHANVHASVDVGAGAKGGCEHGFVWMSKVMLYLIPLLFQNA